MLIEAVEARFGTVEAMPKTLQFLVDNGGAYRSHDTHAVARQLGLDPIHTPVCNPQSNGMVENFINIFKRDNVSRMDCSTAERVLAQLPDAFEHFNSALKYKSPRLFRKELRRQAQQTDPN
jgi:transposase InsO family protein